MYVRPEVEREIVLSACFVRVFVALEEYLEAAFGHYIMGGLSVAGWSPVVYAKPPTVDHAHGMFIGLQRFMDWSTPDQVRKLAKLYFANGDPFDAPLASSLQTILDMKTVRNAASHVSRTTTAPLDALYSRWTASPRRGVSAYEMILAQESKTSRSFLLHAELTVSAVARQIATHK